MLTENETKWKQALPGLFKLVSKFDTSDARMAASSTLSVVDSLHRNRERLVNSPLSPDVRARYALPPSFFLLFSLATNPRNHTQFQLPLQLPRRPAKTKSTSRRLCQNPPRDANRRRPLPKPPPRDPSPQYERSHPLGVRYAVGGGGGTTFGAQEVGRGDAREQIYEEVGELFFTA